MTYFIQISKAPCPLLCFVAYAACADNMQEWKLKFSSLCVPGHSNHSPTAFRLLLQILLNVSINYDVCDGACFYKYIEPVLYSPVKDNDSVSMVQWANVHYQFTLRNIVTGAISEKHNESALGIVW